MSAGAATHGTGPAEHAPAARPAGRLRSLKRAIKQVFGIPDFDRYCEHLREAHPGAPLPSEREFHAMAIDRRYGAARPRCC